MVYASSLGSGSSCDEADEQLNHEFVAELFDNSDCLGEPVQRKNFNMTHSYSYPSFMIKIDESKLWSARVVGDNVEENCEEFTPKLFRSTSVWIDARMKSSSPSSELSWYITAGFDEYASDYYAYIFVLDEPRRQDCLIDDYDCNFSWCSHREYSDNSYMPCSCNSVDGGYGNNEGLPDESVLGYETINKERFYTSTVYFYNYGSDYTSQPCDMNVDIKFWYNNNFNGWSFYSPSIPCFNVSSPLADSYDNYENYEYYDYNSYEYDSYDSYEYDYYDEFDAEKFSENEDALIYGEEISTYWMFISCMASKEDGSQSWLFLEKPFFVDYFSATPKGFCECIHNENEGKDYAAIETIKNCYGQSVSEAAARSIVSPVRPPMEAPLRKQKHELRKKPNKEGIITNGHHGWNINMNLKPNKEGMITNDNKKPTETKAH